MRTKTPERVARARAMRAEGCTHADIAAEFGISQSTVRQWVEPGQMEKCRRYQAMRAERFRDKFNAAARERRKLMTDEQRSVEAAKQRIRYANSPSFRKALADAAKRHRLTAQGKLAALVRRLNLGHADRHSPIHTDFMVAATGMSRAGYAERFKGDGHFDHVVPICAFDLTNPQHLLRCLHPSNIRIVPEAENFKKGPSIPDGLDVMSLPGITTPDVIARAEVFISRQLADLEKRIAKASEIAQLPD